MALLKSHPSGYQSLNHARTWERGRDAFLRGEPITSCPYKDVRDTYHNSVTGSKGYMMAWKRGWYGAKV